MSGPALVDVAAALAAPLERRALERHRVAAERRLASVLPLVIAVTGSWGKTSTKNHIRDLLSGSVAVVASPASYNNTAGLSRTVNEHLAEGTDVLVAEMGMYGPGEIRNLCSWIRPDIAVICAIGPMHLERVGSIEGIVEAKAEILERTEVGVLWVDDPRLRELANSLPMPKLWRVGRRGDEGLDVEVEVVEGSIVIRSGGDQIGSCPVTSGAPHPPTVSPASMASFGGVPWSLSPRLIFQGGAVTAGTVRLRRAVHGSGHERERERAPASRPWLP